MTPAGRAAGEDQRRGHASEDTAEHEDPVVLEVLRHAGEDVEGAVGDATPLPDGRTSYV